MEIGVGCGILVVPGHEDVASVSRKRRKGLAGVRPRHDEHAGHCETTHWTAHESRLARDFGAKRFGSEGYAIEELVAELGAAFLCADLGLTLEPRESAWCCLSLR